MYTEGSHIPRGLMVVLCGLLLVAGCGPKQDREPITDPATRQLVARASQALEADEYGLALALADSAARRAPGAVEPHFLKGLIYSRTLRWDEAEAAYLHVIERDPEFPGVWNNLANNAVWRGEYEDALAYYRKEIELAPAAMPWSGIGRIYFEKGRIDSAAYAFKQAISLDSSYIPAYLSYARLLEDDGQFEGALALAREAAARAPEATEVKYMLGSLLDRTGREDAAVSYLEAVTRAWPWHTESHYKLGRLLQRVGREEESREILAIAEDLWKKQADITVYQKGLTTDPDNPYAHAALATAFRMAGRYDEAVRTYNIALSLDPRNLEFQNNLASLYFLKKDTAAAIETYHRILEQDPTMAEVWVNLGVLYALTGETSAAREAWRRALIIRPDDPQIRAYLAKLETSPR